MGWEIVNEAMFSIRKFGLAWKFLTVEFPELLTQGSISIETVFRYNSTSKADNDTFRFRTTLQPDGDIINFLPDPHLFLNDEQWIKSYEEGYRTHQENIQRLMVDLDIIDSIIRIVSKIITTITVALSAIQLLLKQSLDIKIVVLIGLSILLSLHKFLINPLLKMIIRLFIKKKLRNVAIS